ncbi:MAG: SDR family NAD(P)-dependent oxidoreductase [Alphaproteobacteria bacterium]|nr:MAG: SDR family NAD(P)-dependent oxidoreductase [Alphaproteobacteria bacterium]
MLDPSGRVIMISGANRGIGLAIARRLGRAGYTLSLGARDKASLTAALGAETTLRGHFTYDAADRDTHRAWVADTLLRWGRIDGLVNNAGMGSTFTIEAGEEEELDRIWTVNCKGPLFLTRECLPHLRRSGTGRIVNVSSLSGKRVRNENVAYNMTKHALMALSHGTRRIGWADGIRVTTLCPSFVRTDLTADVSAIAPEQMIDPDDLAELVATVLALPNTAAVAELLVNCRLEDRY